MEISGKCVYWIGFIFLMVLYFVYLHVCEFKDIPDIYAKILTLKMFMYSVLNVFCVVAVGLGFGKPYSVVYASAVPKGLIMMIVKVKKILDQNSAPAMVIDATKEAPFIEIFSIFFSVSYY
jgi:hypothetical protein